MEYWPKYLRCVDLDDGIQQIVMFVTGFSIGEYMMILFLLFIFIYLYKPPGCYTNKLERQKFNFYLRNGFIGVKS